MIINRQTERQIDFSVWETVSQSGADPSPGTMMPPAFWCHGLRITGQSSPTSFNQPPGRQGRELAGDWLGNDT